MGWALENACKREREGANERAALRGLEEIRRVQNIFPQEEILAVIKWYSPGIQIFVTREHT
jgi:hypothetical protein